jgi:hypothetical protein
MAERERAMLEVAGSVPAVRSKIAWEADLVKAPR